MEGYFLYIATKLDKLRTGPKRSVLDIIGEIKSWDLWRAVFAEGIATMLFVFVGTASIVFPMGEDLDGARIVRIAFTFGLMIAVLIQMFGHVSGGHMNPAVSIGMAVAVKISPLRALLYVIFQCGGALLGSLILKSITPDAVHSNLGVNTVSPLLSEAKGFGCELVYTFILVFSIFGCTDENRPFFGSPALGIGLTVGVLHLSGIPYTGASMNPARSFGPAVISDLYDTHWVYWAGPMAGGILAALLYKFIFDPYARAVTMEEAINRLMGETDMIVIPKTYYKEPEQNSKQPTNFHKKQKEFIEKQFVEKM